MVAEVRVRGELGGGGFEEDGFEGGDICWRSSLYLWFGTLYSLPGPGDLTVILLRVILCTHLTVLCSAILPRDVNFGLQPRAMVIVFVKVARHWTLGNPITDKGVCFPAWLKSLSHFHLWQTLRLCFTVDPRRSSCEG